MTKSKSTGKALGVSIVALILCFTMLLGTTFAWFTDTASTAVNKIQAGTLDIELLDKDGGSLENRTLSWKKAVGHENEAVLWEPGASYDLEDVQIVNNGNLALKYKVVITGINGDAKLNEVIDWIVKVGEETYTEGNDISLAVGESNVLTINGTMQTTAGNEYQGLSIDGVAITVYATQDTVEFDSTTNQYDKDAEYEIYVSNIDELRAAVAMGEATVVLKNDITLGDEDLVKHNGNEAMVIVTNDTVIDLNGKTLQYTDGGTCYYGFIVTNGATLTIKDESGTNDGTVYANDPEGTWIVFVANGTANIYGGQFKTTAGCCIYKNKGYINIYEGLFENTDGSSALLNLGNNWASYGPIMVYGGTFKNFEPGVTNGSETKVADGYKVVRSGDYYSVVEESSYTGLGE